MKETVIVVISVDYSNARKVCEQLENQQFASTTELREVLNLELETDEEDKNQPQFFSLSDFMDECNDQYINLENSFISYVNLIH